MQNAPAMLAQKMMNRQAAYTPVGMVSQNMSGNKKGAAAGGASAGLLGLAFDPATAAAGIVLTNNNTTASNPSGPLNIYSAKAKTSGTAVGVVAGYYCEFVVGSASDCFLGIAAATFDTAYANRVGLTSGVAYRNTTGEVFAAGSTVISGLPTATTGDVIGIKFNVTATSSSFTVLKNNVVIVNAYNSTAACPNNSTSFVPVWSSNSIGAIGTISNSIYAAPGYISFTTDGTSALIAASASVPAVADGAYDVYTFNASGTFTAASTGAVRALVIAGGGGGGGSSGAGSGAGGYQEKGVVATPQTYTITVGAGSASGVGSNSSIGAALVSSGGGSGIPFGTKNGGSGGGGYADSSFNIAAGSGVSGQGFAGGSATWVTNANAYANGGGGGAGGNGSSANSSSNGGTGGAGVTSSITGTAVARGGGAGGNAFNGSVVFLGTATAGGGFSQNGSSGAGTANTGGGGCGNNGGSGVVIIRVRARA